MQQVPDNAQHAELPVRPDEQPPSPKKSNGVRIAAIIGAVVVLLAIIGAVTPKTKGAATTVTSGGSSSVATTTQCIDLPAILAQNHTAQDELNAAAASTRVFDVDGAADHTDNAGDAYDNAAALMGAIPQVQAYAESSAEHLHAAANDLRAGDINAATSELREGTADVQSMTSETSALDPSTLTPC